MSAASHETQEACIAALHLEIVRMRGILSRLKPAGVQVPKDGDDAPPPSIRLSQD